MKRYVISDLHLGHQGILKHRTRFKDLVTMEMHIINNWNLVVNKEDKVYILGDVAFKKQALLNLNLMKGKKVLIKGNHDTLKLKDYAKYFDDIRGAMEYNGCILTHIPVHEEQLNHRFKLNIHGHLHNREVQTIDPVSHNFIGDSRYINVCCERVNYTPVLLEELLEEVLASE